MLTWLGSVQIWLNKYIFYDHFNSDVEFYATIVWMCIIHSYILGFTAAVFI